MPAIKHSDATPEPTPPALWTRLKAARRALVATSPEMPDTRPAAAPAAESTTPPAPPKKKGISDAAVAKLGGKTADASTDRLLRAMFPPRPGI